MYYYGASECKQDSLRVHFLRNVTPNVKALKEAAEKGDRREDVVLTSNGKDQK